MPMVTLRRSIQQLHSCPFRGRLQMSGLPATLPLPTAYSSNANNRNRDLRYLLPTPRHFTPISTPPAINRLPDPRGASTTTCPTLHSPKTHRALEPPAHLPTTGPKASPTRNPTLIPIHTCTMDTLSPTQTPTHHQPTLHTHGPTLPHTPTPKPSLTPAHSAYHHPPTTHPFLTPNTNHRPTSSPPKPTTNSANSLQAQRPSPAPLTTSYRGTQASSAGFC